MTTCPANRIWPEDDEGIAHAQPGPHEPLGDRVHDVAEPHYPSNATVVMKVTGGEQFYGQEMMYGKPVHICKHCGQLYVDLD